MRTFIDVRKTQATWLARRFLQLDQPTPEYTDAELAELVQRHYRWNFAMNLVDGATFSLGMSFISASTIVPLFVSKLTPSTVPLGLVAMMAQGGWFLPQLLSAPWVERLPRRKTVVVNLGLVLERVPMLVMVAAAALAGRRPTLALWVFIAGMSWRTLGGGLVGPGWEDLIARVIPVERRGRFWGLTTALGSGVGLLGSAAAAWILLSVPFPANFVLAFSLAAGTVLSGWFFLALVREPAQPVQAPRVSQRQFFASLPHLLREDGPFRRFLGARMLLAFAAMGVGFVAVAAVKRWQVSDGTVGIYTALLLFGQTLGNLVFGIVADRKGHKLSLEVAACAYLAAFALAWLAPTARWFYPVFVFLGLAQGAVLVSGLLVILEFSEPQRRPTYVGIANSAVGVVSMAGPLLAVTLAGVDFRLLFGLNSVVALAALAAMRWLVQDPRWAER